MTYSDLYHRFFLTEDSKGNPVKLQPMPHEVTDEEYQQNMDDLYAENLDTCVNESGGKQSDIPGRYDLLPPSALAAIAHVLKHGADKYGEFNWELIPVHEHINHALRHAFGYLRDKDGEHLSHAACRLLFALDLFITNKNHDS